MLTLMKSAKNKEKNIQEAERLVKLAAHNGAHLIVLPECFNSPYSTACFPKYAEVLHPSPPSKETSPTFHALSRMAMNSQAFIVRGSIPELGTLSQKLYNTSLVFAPTGQLVGFHRKAHLFDVEFPERMSFRESDVLSPENAITVINLDGIGKIGLGICFDVRFPEMAAIAAREGAFALIYPSASIQLPGLCIGRCLPELELWTIRSLWPCAPRALSLVQTTQHGAIVWS
jgi:omega-amidase